MKKKLLYVMALAAMVSCSSDEFVGEGDSPNTVAGVQRPISFEGATSSSVTRADGATAATALGNNFVVFGYKTVSESPQTVFDNYQVNFVTNTANTTESNSANWEYVSYTNLPVGVSTNVGVRAFSALTGSGQANATGIEQSIKYWDFSATQYDFFAYSLGKGNDHDSDAETAPQYARASALSNSTYSLEGSAAELGACYISNKKTLTSLSASTTEVELEFLSFLSKVQLKFYETIPGYSVKNLKFYVAENTKSTGDADNDGLAPALYTASTIPTAGSYTITFNESAPVVTLSSATTSVNNIVFPAVSTGPNVWLSGYVGKDYEETEETVYLGRTSNTATSSKQTDVLPNSTGAVLTLKMDYTLLSRDRSGETIQITGATATIPAEYTTWKPNYAYTYIFKISDNTNGQTGTITGLYPITLDAVVTDTQDGSQETITTISNPSITTYAKGANPTVAANAEYPTGSNIYVVVDKGGTVQTLTVGTNAKLYLVTNNTTGSGATQEITEESVANALANGTPSDGSEPADGVNDTWTVTGANMKDLKVTSIGVPTLTATSTISASDSPTGVAINLDGTNNNCAKFTPTAVGTYAFEFIDTSDNNKKYYKIIKVVSGS